MTFISAAPIVRARYDVKGRNMFFLVDSLYEWNPNNYGSAYNIGHNLDRAANSLQHIDQSVTSIRNSIWANQFFGAVRDYQVAEQRQEYAAHNTYMQKLSSFQDFMNDLMKLSEKLMEKTQIRGHLAEEFKRTGEGGFLKILGYNDFMRYLDIQTPIMFDSVENLYNDYTEFNESSDDPYSKIDYLDYTLLPQLQSISETIAENDCKLEILIDLMKSGLGITRMFAYKESLLEELGDGLEKMRSGKIELPFGLDSLDRAMENLDEEVKLLTKLLNEATEAQLIIYEDHVRIAGWASTIEFRFSSVQKSFEELFEKLKDFKRLYELHWFKNN